MEIVTFSTRFAAWCGLVRIFSVCRWLRGWWHDLQQGIGTDRELSYKGPIICGDEQKAGGSTSGKEPHCNNGSQKTQPPCIRPGGYATNCSIVFPVGSLSMSAPIPASHSGHLRLRPQVKSTNLARIVSGADWRGFRELARTLTRGICSLDGSRQP